MVCLSRRARAGFLAVGLLTAAVLSQTTIAAPPLHLLAPRTYVTGTLPSQVIPTDLDGDGDQDLLVLTTTLPSTPTLQLFENLGDGTLVLHSSKALLSANRLACGDMNGDGSADLVQVRTIGTTGELLMLTRNGPFSFAATTQTLTHSGRHVCIGNLDSAGRPDLAIPDDLASRWVHVYLATGTGSFTHQGFYRTEDDWRDVDGDGDLDEHSDFATVDLALGDLDGDGDDDLVYTNYMRRCIWASTGVIETLWVNSVVRLLNTGDGTLGSFAVLLDPWGGELGVADMDRDADADVVTTGPSVIGPDREDVYLIRNQSNGTFSAAERYASGSGEDAAGDMELHDVDGDDDIDVGIVLFGPLAGNVNDEPVDGWALLRNDGLGHLGPPEVHPAGAGILDLAFAQLDGFSGLEAIAAAADDARVSVHYSQADRYPNPPKMVINDPRHPAAGCEPLAIDSGDLDGDGRADVVVAVDVGSFTDVLALLNGTAAGPSTPSLIDTLTFPVQLFIEPLAGSGAEDLGVIFNGDTAEGVGLHLGVNGGPPAPMQYVGFPGAPSDLAAADVNSDGTLDLAALRFRPEGLTAGISIVAVANDGSLSYLGDIVLGSDDVMAFDARLPYVIAAADLNGDQRKDLVAVTYQILGGSNVIVSVLLNNGNLTFTLREFVTVQREITDILCADVTGDLFADVVLLSVPGMAGGGEGSLEVLPNLGSGQLGTASSYNVGISPVAVAAMQVDASPGIDLIVASDASNEITVLFNNGTGGFPIQERYLSGGGTDGLTLADGDGDGSPDVIVANDDHFIWGHRATLTLLPLAARDSDSDGVPDVQDLCPETIVGVTVDANGCPTPPVAADLDHDGDVDADDLNMLLLCDSGPAVLHNDTPACQAADLDLDHDIDQVDFGLFQRCRSGASHPADPDCANPP